MVVVDRRTGLSILETPDLLGYFCITISRVIPRDGPKKRKYPMRDSSLGENILLIPDPTRDCFELTRRQQ